MHIIIDGLQIGFHKVEINVHETGIENIFRHFHKSTVQQLIHRPKYKHLRDHCEKHYKNLLDLPVGEVLFELKCKGDLFYKNFLNKYGDLMYSHFEVKGNESLLNKKGIYTIVVNKELVFCGVCARSFKERFNHHVGKVSAKGCYKDGTATHCHLNARITELIGKAKIHFTICPIDDEKDMHEMKSAIINRFEPDWNIRANGEGLKKFNLLT